MIEWLIRFTLCVLSFFGSYLFACGFSLIDGRPILTGLLLLGSWVYAASGVAMTHIILCGLCGVKE